MLAKQELARMERNKPNKNADPTILTKDSQIDIQKAVGRNYADFWNSKDRYLVLKGSRSSKKSFNAAQKIIYNMMYYYHKYDVVPNTLVIRRFFNTHKDSTFALLNKVINRFGVSHKWKVTMNPMQLTYLPSGGKIIFKGADNMDSVTSVTTEFGHLCWVWIEEAFQIERETDFDKLDLSIRGTLPEPLYYQIILTLNP